MISLYVRLVCIGHSNVSPLLLPRGTQGRFVDYIEPFKAAAREKRVTIREFSFDPSKAGGLDGLIERAKWDLQQVHSTIVR